MKETLIQIHDKVFKPFISAEQIKQEIIRIAQEINDLHIGESVFISVLNGSFMFTSDLAKYLNFVPNFSFIKVSSYKGLQSTGKIQQIIGLDCDILNKSVFIIEDIIDSGKTITELYKQFEKMGAKEIFIVSLLFKPNAYKGNLSIAFKGFEIPNDFVIGYGMDYDGLGRNLKEIYVLQ